MPANESSAAYDDLGAPVSSEGPPTGGAVADGIGQRDGFDPRAGAPSAAKLCPGSLKADGPCEHGEYDVHPVRSAATVDLVERFELAVVASMLSQNVEQLKAVKAEYDDAKAALLKTLARITQREIQPDEAFSSGDE